MGMSRRRPDRDTHLKSHTPAGDRAASHANANTNPNDAAAPGAPSVRTRPQPEFQFVQVEESTPALKEDLAANKLLEFRTPWVLYIHHGQDRDWSQTSFLKVCGFHTAQGFWTVFNWLRLHPQFHYFLMRESVLPMWEDKQNENGGCFSVRAPVQQAADLWLDMCLYVVGETLLDDYDEMANVLGVSVASSRDMTAVKVWHRQRDQSDTKIPQYFRDRYSIEVKFLNHRSANAPATVSAAAVAAKLMAASSALPVAVPAAVSRSEPAAVGTK